MRKPYDGQLALLLAVTNPTPDEPLAYINTVTPQKSQPIAKRRTGARFRRHITTRYTN